MVGSENNQDIVQALDALAQAIQSHNTDGSWQQYTPTVSNITLGNGTVTAHYRKRGKTLEGRIKLLIGSTTSITGNPTFTLPNSEVFASSYELGQTIMGIGEFLDTATRRWGAAVTMAATNAINVRPVDSGAAYIGYVNASTTIPFTHAAGDYVFAHFTVEVA